MHSRLESAEQPKRVAYADPPFPGMSAKYYRDEPSYAGEVDHAELVAKLRTFDGWALSTSEKTLREVWNLCPEARCASWLKTHPAAVNSHGPHNVWEPVLYVPARREPPGVADAIVAQVARGGGDLPGRKPVRFCQWLFALLGMHAGDSFVDCFPGSGIVSATWRAIVAVSSQRRSMSGGSDRVADSRCRRIVVAVPSVAQGLRRLSLPPADDAPSLMDERDRKVPS